MHNTTRVYVDTMTQFCAQFDIHWTIHLRAIQKGLKAVIDKLSNTKIVIELA